MTVTLNLFLSPECLLMVIITVPLSNEDVWENRSAYNVLSPIYHFWTCWTALKQFNQNKIHMELKLNKYDLHLQRFNSHGPPHSLPLLQLAVTTPSCL